jgi:hypothetical protein
MNPQFLAWFSQGKAAEALCGLDGYFVPDVTSRDEHDFVLAVGRLLEWARSGHCESAARAFENASGMLLSDGKLQNALRLMRSYFVLEKETGTPLPLDMGLLVLRFGQAVQRAAEQLSHDDSLRNLLLSVCQDFSHLGVAVGLPENDVLKS